jgi:pimeloyl-ACP methyl ester carboxylesterase
MAAAEMKAACDDEADFLGCRWRVSGRRDVCGNTPRRRTMKHSRCVYLGAALAVMFGVSISADAAKWKDLPDPGADARHDERHEILTIDHAVPHVSTVPANAGEEVVLFLRERVAAGIIHEGDHSGRGQRGPKAVLFVHGGSVPVVPGLDLPYEDYGWAGYLAETGFDVFLVDLNGYGFSPRPMMTNPCNASADDQAAFLIPNPLTDPCPSDYPFRLNTIESERDEIDTVVDFIRDLRGVERVSLIGWSGGGIRTGTYTAHHPEKVEKLIILASSNYDRSGSSGPPAEVPAPGYPLGIQSYSGLVQDRWFSNVACAEQVEPGIENVAWDAIMHFDPLGSTWGTPAWNPVASPTGGLMRVAQRTNWGWTAEVAAQVEVSTLVMVGEQDGLFDSNLELFEDLGTRHKVFLSIACATHFVTWETQHEVLQDASKAWLLRGRIKGARQGMLSADADGDIHR